MIRPRRAVLLAAGLGAAVFLTALATRPLLPIDETRYASVAWEMWLRGDWLVPYVNGHPYSDKPPLLFWLVLAGWRLFGVSEVWLRLVGPLAGIFNLFLTVHLARALWPERGAVAALAPVLAAGTLLWTVYASLTLFDTLLASCVLLALLAALRARGGGLRWWVGAGAALGLGLLAKGPVVFLHVLPVLLLAPWWARPAGGVARGRWFGGIALACALGAALALGWALPAARAGGTNYGHAILLGQTAGRMVQSFAHRRPFWWYLPLLPAMLVPWAVWPHAWRAARSPRRRPADAGVRFCLAWLVPVFIAFSLISGKQMHYLLPLVPAAALLLARVVLGEEETAPHAARTATALAAATACVVAVTHVALARPVLARYDLRPTARVLGEIERAGRPVAHAGRYQAQYHFLGRLERPFTVIDGDSAAAWLATHPNGAVVRTVPALEVPPAPLARRVSQPYEKGYVEVIERAGSRRR